jgi:hypothetical protein
LVAFADVELRIAAQLEASGARLSGVLTEFAATCREYPLGIDASLADPLRAHARRVADDALWVRRVAEQFAQADAAAALAAAPIVSIVVDRQTQSNSPSTDQVAAVVGPPIPLNTGTIELALEREEFERWLGPLADVALNTPQPSPWRIALEGLKLFLSAVGDTPSECNDTLVSLAQAVRDGPDAVRHVLEKGGNAACRQSRTLIRVTGYVGGVPVDVQAESTLDQFEQQMMAMADGLGNHGGGRPPRTPESTAQRVGVKLEEVKPVGGSKSGRLCKPAARRSQPSAAEIRLGDIVAEAEGDDLVFPAAGGEPGVDGFYRSSGRPFQLKSVDAASTDPAGRVVARSNEAFAKAQKSGWADVDVNIEAPSATRNDVLQRWSAPNRIPSPKPMPGGVVTRIRVFCSDGVVELPIPMPSETPVLPPTVASGDGVLGATI